MAHDHHHDEDLNNYFIEQIFTIAIAGGLGAVALSMYAQNKLRLILHEKFHLWVLLGGAILLLLVLIRAIAVWQLAGKTRPAATPGPDHDHGCCAHDHDHQHQHEAITAAPPAPTTSLDLLNSPALPASGHEHGHDHDCCAHDHGHEHNHGLEHSHGAGDGHDHGWAPWRYVLLLLPVALFFLQLPSEAFSGETDKPFDPTQFDLQGQVGGKEGLGEKVYEVGFLELERVALTPHSRSAFEGRIVRLTGMYVGLDERSFTMSRLKMNCCNADAVPLKAMILLAPSSPADGKAPQLEPGKLRGKWVQVTGQVRFLKQRNSNDYVTALIVSPTEEKQLSELVQVVRQPNNPYAD